RTIYYVATVEHETSLYAKSQWHRWPAAENSYTGGEKTDKKHNRQTRGRNEEPDHEQRDQRKGMAEYQWVLGQDQQYDKDRNTERCTAADVKENGHANPGQRGNESGGIQFGGGKNKGDREGNNGGCGKGNGGMQGGVGKSGRGIDAINSRCGGASKGIVGKDEEERVTEAGREGRDEVDSGGRATQYREAGG
ncbi:hypothetical protein C0993_008031, partial [Termitomyces sp. T159_Od127]